MHLIVALTTARSSRSSSLIHVGQLLKSVTLTSSSLMQKIPRASIHLSVQRADLSDPFRSKANRDKQEYAKFVKKNAQMLNKTHYENEKVSRLGETFSALFNTTTLSDKLDRKFKLDEHGYELVYLIDNERVYLVLFGLLNILFPTIIGFILLLLVAEFMEISRLDKSFDNPISTMLMIAGFTTIYFYMAKRLQSRLVYRIYYSQKEQTYAFVEHKRILQMNCEKFKRDNFKYNNVADSVDSLLKQNMKKARGNVIINDKYKQIDFSRFASKEVIDNLVGIKNSSVIMRKECSN